MDRTKTYVVFGLVAGVLAIAGLILFNTMSKEEVGTGVDTDRQNTVQQPEQQSEQQPVASNSVVISNHAYSPATITVKKGTTVTWTNQDFDEHDITPDSPTDDFKQSNLLGRGDSYSVTFNETGTFTYFCTPHPEMIGSVEVVE